MAHDIVAFDPGNHTGIAWKDGDVYGTNMIFEDLPRVYTYLVNKPKLVVVEQFYTPGNIDRHGLYTVRLIGGIQALCWLHHVPLVEHMPGPPQPLVEKARAWHKERHLKYTQHHLDSLAHLWLYEEQQANPKLLNDKRSLREKMGLE